MGFFSGPAAGGPAEYRPKAARRAPESGLPQKDIMEKIAIKALSGPVKGKIFELRDSLIFGRSEGDVILRDMRVSNPHAEVKIYKSGRIMIIDKDSKNGVEINGERKIKSVLDLNSTFFIGVSEFKVIQLLAPEKILAEAFKKYLPEIRDEETELSAFPQPLELQFLKGPQKGLKRFLAYGPRCFGSESVDGPLFDAEAPKDSFSLLPLEGEILFETDYPEIIKLNGESAAQKAVKTGDIISFGSSQIKISLVSQAAPAK